MSIPENLMYTNTHEWLEFVSENSVRIGITDFAQKRMRGIVFIDLLCIGDTVAVGQRFGDIESIKAVFEVFSPVSGIVAAVNTDVIDAPEKINESPYESWLIEVSDVTSYTEKLLDADVYRKAAWDDNAGENEEG